jgi:dTDP-4-dehydrorhamnose 3,5-epimerase-like enzyme
MLQRYKVLGDTRGSLIALESERNIPFEIKRVYYIFNTMPGVARGFHAHKMLRQILVCVAGSCTIVLDDGCIRSEYVLDRPDIGLEIGPCTWREMKNFSEEAVLLVLASDYYNEDDYIREYSDFLSFIKNGH